MLVRWNERPTPMRQRSCGGTPVTSRPLSTTRPVSQRRWPVIRLNSVVFPAPLGPMIALTLCFGTSNETRETATKPSNDLVRSRTSSTPRPPEPAPEQLEGATQPAGKAEQQHDEDGAEHERPVLGTILVVLLFGFPGGLGGALELLGRRLWRPRRA